VDRARLWTLPTTPPQLIGPAISVETATWVAEWADGLVTIAQPHDKLRQMIDAYRTAGGTGRVACQVHLSYADTDDHARAIAHDQWRSNVFPPPICWDLETAEAFDTVAEKVRPEDMDGSVQISADLGWHAERLNALLDIGFDELYLHHVGQQQTEFIEAFGEHVLPQLDVSSRG